MLKQGRRRKDDPAFCNNPWNLSAREAQIMILFAEFSREQIAKETSITTRTVDVHSGKCRRKIGVGHTAAACVQFDRWWQQWQKDHRDELPAALALLEEADQ